MDSKRDIRPKLASRLLKDSLVLHCLFRVSLATQHIIGTIIFLKQHKTRIRVTFFESTRARPVQRDDYARTSTACCSATRWLPPIGTPGSAGRSSRIRLTTRTTSIKSHRSKNKNKENPIRENEESFFWRTANERGVRPCVRFISYETLMLRR